MVFADFMGFREVLEGLRGSGLRVEVSLTAA